MADPRFHPSEVAEARRYVDDHEVPGFVERQRRARLRVGLTRAFYLRYPSRMSALQMLAVTGVALIRIAARSPAYDAITALLTPVGDDGLPRTEAWHAYVRAFEEGRPRDYLEERWLAAHVADMAQVRAEGWVEAFEAELAAHRDDPRWRAPAHHMAVTLGTRANDAQAIGGQVALETAMASALLRVLRNQAIVGLALLAAHVGASVRAVLTGGPWVPPHLPSDRQLVAWLCGATLRLPRVGRVVRVGIKRTSRGAAAPRGVWSLRPALDEVLGDEAARLHPLVERMFDRMADFRMTASVHLHHGLGSWVAWAAVLLVGQGMYEQDLDEVDARFDLFRRDDGSMHFVREFWCADAIRVFDSDFLVREVEGRRVFVEQFSDLGLAAQMHTERLEDGGLAMTIVRVFVRGVPVGVGPFYVRFETRPVAEDRLAVEGVCDLRATSRLSRWFWHRLLRLPERLGAIRYAATPQIAATMPTTATTSA